MSISEISNLHAPSIVDALFEIDRLDNAGQQGKKGNKKENRQVMALRISSSIVSKEVKKLRACDLASCLYCREWATLALRRGFGSNSKCEPSKKTPDKVKSVGSRKEFINTLLNSIGRDPADTEESRQKLSFLEADNSLLERIVRMASDRVQLHTSPDNLINFFEKMDFSLDNLSTPCWHLKESDSPAKLLEAVDTSEKGSLSLTRENFDALKVISPALQASLTIPVCDHTKENILPDQLKESVSNISVQLKKFSEQCARDWEVVAAESWGLFFSFLDSLLKFEHTRTETVSSHTHKRCLQFHKELNNKPRSSFTEYWTQTLDLFRKGQSGKKKPSTFKDPLATLDELFLDFFNSFVYSLQHFNVLLDSDFSIMNQLLRELRDLLKYWLNLSKARAGRHENLKKFKFSLGNSYDEGDGVDCIKNINTIFFNNFNLAELPKQNVLQAFLLQWSNSSETALKAIQASVDRLEKRLNDFNNERAKKEQSLADQCSHIITEWKASGLTAVALKIEKSNNKDYRRQIRKLEMTYTTYRIWASNQMDTMFPLSEVAELVVDCLDPLMQEAQLLHLVNFLDFFYDRYQSVVDQHLNAREKATKEFGEGLLHGLRMLGGIAGKLFLKEGLRLLEDAKAIEKQNELLQLWDLEEGGPGKDSGKSSSIVDSSEPKGKKKNKRKKKKNGEDLATETPNSPMDAEKFVTTPLSPLFTNHTPQPVPNVEKVEVKAQVIKPEKVEVKAPPAKPVKVEEKAPVSKPEKKAPTAINSKPTPQVEPLKLVVKPLSATAAKLLPHIQSEEDKKLLQTLSEVEPSIENLNGLIDKLAQGRLDGKEKGLALSPESRSSAFVQTAQGVVDLTTVSQEKLIVFVQSLLLDKSSLLEAFTEMKGRLDNMTKLYTKVLTSIQEKDDALIAQAQEIKNYKHSLILRDIELLKLVHQQNALRKAMLDQPDIRANLNAMLANPSHILNSTLSADFFLSESASMLVDDLDPSRQEKASLPTKTAAQSKSKKGKRK
ncbi:hypothetical protein DSO57_1033453 [Entomophthora muscae]|uniref:Uncharacterized protein n=1 Tax=Entomophthora muscae TaxID=34485 RepID=A0ACC2SD27_9FUNG|nr:hypothetical protein DSO57_1033453 [Entomophthora muscae]